MTPTSTAPHRPVTDADIALLTRLQNGDRDAFADLYRGTAARLTRYVTARLRERDADAVEDVVQEAFCHALADPHLLGADLLGSMLQLAARAITQHGWSQRRYVRAAYTVHEDRTTDIPPAPPAAMLRQPGFSQILARLTMLQRQVIQLRYLDGYPRDRAAAQMGRTVTSLRWLERAALRRLHAECAANPTWP